jgi:tetratricopeptide (TPR) repeat protein
MKRALILANVTLLACIGLAGAKAQPAQSEKSATYGNVHFPISCAPAAQEQFDRAVAMLHSFFYPETVKAFTKVTETDPKCAMAYWGIAISQRPNPLVPPFAPDALRRGYDAVEKGESLGTKTQREADWLKAMELFFKDSDKLDQATRGKLYANAMEQLYLHYPRDTEAAIFYALALLETVDPSDRDYTNQLKAAAILEKIEAQQPNHPGVVHYLIHAYDYQPLAARGLPAANRYADLAPSAPHALHMPSHTYSMMGMWEESIKANQAALAAANDYAAKNYPDATNPAALHSMDFMEYAYLQLGKDKQAKAIADQAAAVKKIQAPGMTMSTDNALAAVPARYALERGDWARAAILEPHPGLSGYAGAITYFVRTIGALKTGDTEGAHQDIDRLKELYASYAGKPDEAYWASQTQVLFQAASAWLTLKQGEKDRALVLMRAAVDLDESSEKNVAMENRLVPMRELLGYMLLEIGQPKQALAEFEASLKAKPNRLRGYYGAAKAAEAAGDRAAARTLYGKLVTLTKNADTERAEVIEAKAFLAKIEPKTAATDR